MALSNVRQYVGARYVPKFVNAPTYEWTSNTAYEALSIVLYNNTSYTSIIPVPATVGNPADNPKYWARTGDYNAQVEQYRTTTESYSNEVKEYQNTVNDVNNKINTHISEKPWLTLSWLYKKKTVVYGDSLSAIEANYWSVLSNEYGFDITNRAVPGDSTAEGYNHVSTSTDLANFDNIVLAYGTNDWQAAQYAKDSFEGNIENMLKFIFNANKFANVVFITPFYSENKSSFADGLHNNRGYTLKDYANFSIEACRIYGVPVINLSKISSTNSLNISYKCDPSGAGIYVHENNAFGRAIAEYVARFELDNSYMEYMGKRSNLLNYCIFEKMKRIDSADYGNIYVNNRCGICLELSGSTIYENKNTVYVPSDYIYFTGYSSENVAINIMCGDKTVAVLSLMQGDFSYLIDNRYGGYPYFTFTINNRNINKGYLANLQLFGKNSTLENETNFGFGAPPTYIHPQAETKGEGLIRLWFTDKEFSIGSGTLTLNIDFAKETPILGYEYNKFPTNMPGYNILAISSDGKLYTLTYKPDGYLYNQELMPSGPYNIIGTSQHV